MGVHDLWKYCTQEQTKEMLLSFQLLEGLPIRPEKRLACLYAVSNHVEMHYHAAKIKKRSGGVRHLLIPDRLLQGIQKNLLDHIVNGISVSEYATAYKMKTSVSHNALPHVGQKQIMKLDIKNFFDHITFVMVYQKAFPAVYFPPAVRRLLSALCCYEDTLPQGAPTSPAISNLVMRDFDEYMGMWCKERQVQYTRYCDDMTFSGVFDEKELKNKVRSYLQVMGFELNNRKTKVLGQYCRQTVTGLVVNEKLNVGREYRRKLRSDVYYCKKYGVEEHIRCSEQKEWMYEGEPETTRYLQHLLGQVHFILQITPEAAEFQQAREDIKSMLEWALPEDMKF